jgi:hypothetical protein
MPKFMVSGFALALVWNGKTGSDPKLRKDSRAGYLTFPKVKNSNAGSGKLKKELMHHEGAGTSNGANLLTESIRLRT